MIIKVFDLETTGFEPPARVCEIAMVNVVSTAVDLAGDACNWVVEDGISQWLCDPGEPIPAINLAVHHIIDDDVRGKPAFGTVASSIFAQNPNAPDAIVCAAHSAKFEQLWLTPEITGPAQWICTYKCALRLWPDAPSHSNQTLRYWRRPEGLDRAIANVAHRAGPDAYVTAFHLRDMLNGGAHIDQLVEWSAQPALQVTCHIGKYRNQKWELVDSGFMDWILGRDFDEDVHFTCRHWLEKRAATQDTYADGEWP